MGDMNQRMAGVFAGIALAFVAVVGLLTWWQLIAAGDLRDKDYNNQTAYYQQRIKRGFICSADGVVLARNRAERTQNGDTIYHRRYPQGSLAAHAVGYYTTGKSSTGVERTRNDALTGSTRELASILGKLEGDETVVGDSVQLTINAKAQRIAERALGGRRGSVVALEPRTGRVLVMASAPSFDLNAVESNFGQVNGAAGSPLFNRATQARYQPGSTFKIVTAATALEDGVPVDQTFPGGCKVKVLFGTIANFGGSCHGPHDFATALTLSINTTFAALGEQVGAAKLRAQMEAFGFYSTPPLDGDLPSGELRASGLYDGGKLLDAEGGVDAARLAIGQKRLQVTPLQMAMVAAGVANRGRLMDPFLVEQVLAPNGTVQHTTEPMEYRQVMSAANAEALGEMMQNVVREGTGTAAALTGIDVAGKSGTADTSSGNQVWFIAFAPAESPRVAVAVTIEAQRTGATGGVVAAPIARDVLEALL